MTWKPGVENESRDCTGKRYIRKNGLLVRCGVCKHCRWLRGRDWAGRAIAESLVADRALFTTLTVGGDRMYSEGVQGNERARSFHLDDVRAYVKRLRDIIKPGRMRFMAVGENGDRKGRVHYHQLQYFYGSEGPKGLLLNVGHFHGKMSEGLVEMYPEVTHLDGPHTYWPWGTVLYREFQPRHSFYLASYVTKTFGTGDGCEYTRPAVSTKPLLGAKWFKWYALSHVAQELSPQTREYQFARGADYPKRYHPVTGDLLTPMATYWMGDATWRYFVREFVTGWRLAHGKRPWPRSDVVELELEAIDDDAAARRPYDWADWFEKHGKIIAEKTGRWRRHEEETSEDWAVARYDAAGRTLVDDALNQALAAPISDEEWHARYGDLIERVGGKARWKRG